MTTATANSHDDWQGNGRPDQEAHSLRVVGAVEGRSDSCRASQGHLFLDSGREALHRLQQPVHVGQHRTRRRARDSGDQRAGSDALLCESVHGDRSRARGWARSLPRSRPAISTRSSSPMVVRRLPKMRLSWRELLYRTPQDHGALPFLSRRDGWRDELDGRPAALGGRARACPAWCGFSILIMGSSADGNRRESSLAMIEETIQLEGPHTIAAFILETVTGTNGILDSSRWVYPGSAQALRQVRHRDDLPMRSCRVLAARESGSPSITGRSFPT